MPGTPLSDTETVVRYVGGSHFDRQTGQFNGSAFDRTPKDTDGLSLNRRGILSTDQDTDRREIQKISASRLTLGKTAVFAELNVGAALAALAEYEEDISFVEDPLAADGEKLSNPAHALLLGIPFKGEKIGSLKSEVAGDRLRQCIENHFPAIDPTASS